MGTDIPLGFGSHLDGYYDAALDLQMHVYQRSDAQFERWERHKDGLTTPEQIADWQRYLRTRTIELMGGLPPSDTPLQSEHTGTLRSDGFDIEQIIFQSLPDVFVTGNLYLPHGLHGPTGAVLFVCGHAEHAKAHPAYQGVCQRLARNGLVVFAIDPIGQGERKSYMDSAGNEQVRWGTVEHTYAAYQCWLAGQSIVRYFVHDAIRAIDYLVTRPEDDAARIAITGSSGGGTQAAWMMLVEPRLAAAAPGTFITRRREYMWTGQSQDGEQILSGGTAAGIDHEDSLIAMAPRPVLVLAAEYDFFALEGTVATVERARPVYRLLGKEENIELARARCTHQYHPALAQAATTFFARHLLGRDAAAVDHTEPRPFSVEELRCTRSGQVLLDRPQIRRVFDLNLAEFHATATEPANTAARADVSRRWLLEVMHRHRDPLPEFFPRWLPGPKLPGVSVLRGFWRPERGILNAGILLRPSDRAYSALLLACFDEGTAELESRRDWLLEQVAAGNAVLALDVRGAGALTPHAIRPGRNDAHSTLYKLATDLLWLDDSLAAAQVFDVLRAVEFSYTDPEIALGARPIRLFGSGRGAFRGCLAAALDPRLEAVEFETPLPDLQALVTDRLYLQRPGWVQPAIEYLIPGLAAHASLADLDQLLAGRRIAPA